MWNKFFAIVRREYLTRVRSKMFIVGTLLFPLMATLWSVVPSLLFTIRTGDATRLAVIDRSGKLYPLLQARFSNNSNDAPGNDSRAQTPDAVNELNQSFNQNSTERIKSNARKFDGAFVLEQIAANEQTLDSQRDALAARLENKALDGYLIVPPDAVAGTGYELHVRNRSDIFTQEQIKRAVNDSVRDLRLQQANIDKNQLTEINKDVSFDAQGGNDKNGSSGSANFFFVFGIGLMMYLVLIIYGQSIMAAVVEEKETRIAEILFSSVNSFQLMLGKLAGISLVALTQLSIWLSAVGLFLAFGVARMNAAGMNFDLHFSWNFVPYMLLFFLAGYSVYAALFALVGSMVTTPQEGGQLAFPITMLLVISFMLSFVVIRNPESNLAVALSLIPFCAPIVMPVRIVAQTPPFWQIVLSLLSCGATAILLLWLAGRVYRVGMLMYGKRATIPEIMRWIRQT